MKRFKKALKDTAFVSFVLAGVCLAILILIVVAEVLTPLVGVVVGNIIPLTVVVFVASYIVDA